jgi:DNA polymerase
MTAVDPDLVVCLGATAAKAILGPSFRVTKQRGEVIERETSLGLRRFVATVHPSSILRSDDRDTAYAAFLADLHVVAGCLGTTRAT